MKKSNSHDHEELKSKMQMSYTARTSSFARAKCQVRFLGLLFWSTKTVFIQTPTAAWTQLFNYAGELKKGFCGVNWALKNEK